MTRILGIVPSRSGSKRVPGKNLMEVGGTPLLGHAIQQGSAAEHIDELVVSTDDPEMQNVAREYGGSVPFDRPTELARDETSLDEVAAHAVDWFAERGELFDVVCVIPTTTPFREPSDIDGAIERLLETDAKSVVAVSDFDAPPFWAVEAEDDRIKPYFDTNPWEKTQTQGFPTLLHPNGALFGAITSALENEGGFYTDETTYYEMPRQRSLDIDEPYDLELARALAAWRDQ